MIPLDLPKGDETRSAFYSLVAGKNEDNMLAYWSRLVFTGKGTPPETAADNQELQYLLSRNPDLVGYISESDLDADFNLKVVFKVSK